MLSELVTKKLKKILNPNRFKFVIILYNSTQDIPKIKEFIKKSYPETKDKTLKLQNSSYSELTNDLYSDNSFIYIDDFEEIFGEDELYLAFNQRRDKLASHTINLVIFYPKKLQSKLYQDALKFIPDLWEFRTAVIELEGSESELKNIEIKEDRSFLEYSGLNYKEKLKEIQRLDKKLKNVKSDKLKSNIYNNLGFLYQELGEYEKALPFYDKAIKIIEEVLGKNHPNRAIIYSNLAGLYRSIGEYEKALALYKKAININEEILGKEHPDTAISYNNLAELYESIKEYEKALRLYKKALNISEKVLGKEHPNTATIYNNLAVFYANIGKYQESHEYMKKALKIRQKVLPASHPDLIDAKKALKQIQQKLK